MTKNVLISAETEAAAIFDPAKLVDELGLLKAQIAALESREKEITAALKEGGRDSYSGTLYDCSVSSSNREMLDSKRLYADLGRDMFADYIKSTPVVTLRVTAKK